MTAKATRDLLRRFVDELVNRYDLALVDELFAPGCHFYFISNREPLDREGYKKLVTMFRTAFLDLCHTAEAVVAEEDALAERFRVRGTHLGEFRGLAPSGRVVDFSGMLMFRLAHGKVVEAHFMPDLDTLMRQLGSGPG
jgi:steroid delta-isomerase-like uncharacterized protein